MQTLLPGPRVGLEQVRAFDLAPVFKREGIRAFALHQQGTLMRLRDVAHQLRVAEPAISHDHRAGNVTPRVAKAAKRSSSMLWVRVSLSWQRRPGPVGLGRRMAKSSGMMSLPSPMT